MYKSEITAVFLAAILFTGAITAAIPSFTEDVEAETSTDQREIKDKEGKGESQEQVTSNDQMLKAMKLYFTSQDSLSDSDTSSVKDNYGNAAGSEASSDEKGYYSGSSSYGQVFIHPSYGTDYGNDYDKKILKKIIVVCPDGSELSFNGDNGIMTGGLHEGENRFIDNVFEKVCPAIDSCEECFDWILNFADNRTEAVAIVNTVIETLNEQNSIEQPDLLPVDFRADGYEGSNIWEISKFFNRLLEDRTNQGQAISALRSTIQESVDTQEVTPIVGSLAIDVIECIAKLEGIAIPLTQTNGNNNPNQASVIPLTSVSSGTVR